MLNSQKNKMADKKMDSALKVMEGVEAPKNTDDNAVNRFKKIKRKQRSPEEYVEQIRNKNITVLSQAITLLESSKKEHQEISQKIIEQALPFSGNSIRVGITGVPGVGKSTFIEELGCQIIHKGHKLAVLAIDPSSEKTKGSILGDKTRMELLSVSKDAYIRPSPSAGTLGGVARKTRESIILCEAAGFDVIFIETVGVGQSETAVYSMVDFFLLLMLAGAGDELQGIKRGIMEMADDIVITKADGANYEKALRAQAEYKNAIHLFPPSNSNWETKVQTCSSLESKGIDEVWASIEEYQRKTIDSGYMKEKRRGQTKYWMYETIHSNLMSDFYQNEGVKNYLKEIEGKVLDEQISPFMAAGNLLKEYYKG